MQNNKLNGAQTLKKDDGIPGKYTPDPFHCSMIANCRLHEDILKSINAGTEVPALKLYIESQINDLKASSATYRNFPAELKAFYSKTFLDYCTTDSLVVQYLKEPLIAYSEGELRKYADSERKHSFRKGFFAGGVFVALLFALYLYFN